MKKIFTLVVLSLMAFAATWAQSPAPTDLALNGEVKADNYGGLTIPIILKQGGVAAWIFILFTLTVRMPCASFL